MYATAFDYRTNRFANKSAKYKETVSKGIANM